MALTNYNTDTSKAVVPMNQTLGYIALRSNPKAGGTLADQAYEHILKEIVFPEESRPHEIEYGGKITESVLAKSLKMSNGPVREAIFRLRQEGWIHTIGNRGTFLVDFSDRGIAREIYMYRLSFETGAFYSLAASVTDEQLTALERTLNTMETAIAESNIGSFREADIKFHLQVAEFAGGASYSQLFRPKLMQWYAMSFNLLTERMGLDSYRHNLEAPGASSHRELLDSLAARDSERAARLSRQHQNYIPELLGIDDPECINDQQL